MRRRRLSSKTALAKAIRCALTRGEALALYLGDGRIGIDNNVAERSLCRIAFTRISCSSAPRPAASQMSESGNWADDS
jgi:hypothetical protein